MKTKKRREREEREKERESECVYVCVFACGCVFKNKSKIVCGRETVRNRREIERGRFFVQIFFAHQNQNMGNNF